MPKEETPISQPLEGIIHNCHVHIFNIDHIPKYFISPFIPTSWIKNKRLANFFYKLFRNKLNRYSAFFYSALQDNQEGLLNELQGYYPTNTRFAPLSIDFEYMGAGQPIKSYEKQLKELAILKAHPDYKDVIFPFICVDPRRPNIYELVRHYIENHQFTGIKMYPAIGYFPNDKRLYKIYEYAEVNEIPITTHCIPKNKNHYRGEIKPEWYKQAESMAAFDPEEAKTMYDFAQYLGHPYWWKQVLDDFPELKINLGHFGGNTEWDKYLDSPSNRNQPHLESWYRMIRRLIEEPRFKNVYADISFTVHDPRLYPILKNLLNTENTKDFVLFGSDFYMMQKDYRERRFSMDVRGYLDDAVYWQLVEANAKRFLSNRFHKF